MRRSGALASQGASTLERCAEAFGRSEAMGEQASGAAAILEGIAIQVPMISKPTPGGGKCFGRRGSAPAARAPRWAARVAAWDHPQWPGPKKIGGELTSSVIGPLAQGLDTRFGAEDVTG
jgi:hypothetical protein